MYGARAQRVPARGPKNLADVDVYKLVLLGRTERGVDKVHDNIFDMNDFVKKCGGFKSGFYSAYEVKSFYDTLKRGVNVELKVRGFVASDAAQSSVDIMDGHGTPDKVFTLSAGLKGDIDKSAFGDKIGYKISQSFNYQYSLAADSTASASTQFVLTSVEHLQVGYLYKVVDTGTAKTEWAFITAIDEATKTVTFAALGNATLYAAATTTLYRADWNLELAVKDEKGVFQKKEEWLEMPFAESDLLGAPLLLNDAVSGSYYGILAFDDTNASDPAVVLPAAVTSWTALSGGSDGTGPTDSDWNTLSADLADDDSMIFLAPESTSKDHNENMSVFSSDGEKFMYFGQAANGATEDILRELGLSLRSPVRFAMIPCDKWLEVEDELVPGSVIDIPPVGVCAAHWFNIYSTYGIGKVAAGNADVVNTTARLLDSNGLVHDDVGGAGDRMIRKYSVNIARFRRGKGITVNSARTLSTDTGYIFQNQIMGFLLLKKSILAYLQGIEQDPSGTAAQESHYNAVYAYLKKKYNANVFYRGQKEDGTPTEFSDVVKIVNDFSVNTLADIANGKETIFVQTVFTPPIEEPILSLASASVTTIRA